MVGLNVSVETVSPAPVPKSPTPSSAPPTTPGANQSPNPILADLEKKKEKKKRALLAALLESRDPPQQGTGTGQTGEFGLGEEQTLRFYFCIYVTDKNMEPVRGLQEESFTVQHLLIPVGTFVQLNPETTFWESDLPGVYRLNQRHPTCQGVDIFGVTVRRRKPKRNRAGTALVAAEFETGFCMVTVVGEVANASST